MPLPLNLLPLDARSAMGASDPIDVLGHPTVELSLVMAGQVGAASLEVQLETSEEGIVWMPAGDLVQVTAAPTPQRLELRRSSLERYVRAGWNVVNGPLTFRLVGQALQVLATREDILSMGWVPHGLEAYSDEDVDKALGAQSDIALGYLNQARGVVPPILGWGRDVRWAVVQLAVYDLYCNKGTLDPITIDRAKMALDWLKSVAAGKLAPVGLVSSPVASAPETAASTIDHAWAWSDPPWGFR